LIWTCESLLWVGLETHHRHSSDSGGVDLRHAGELAHEVLCEIDETGPVIRLYRLLWQEIDVLHLEDPMPAVGCL